MWLRWNRLAGAPRTPSLGACLEPRLPAVAGMAEARVLTETDAREGPR